MVDNSYLRRADYRFFVTVPTRWNDNDQLGHVNNVLYYTLAEVVLVRFLDQELKVDWRNDPVVPFTVENRCHFCRPLSFPAVVEAGFRVARLGTTSVTYAIALFEAGQAEAAALLDWVHVFVERDSEKPVPIPPAARAVFERFRQ
jgi:acyl-CoA thioester hydrolase